MSLLLGVTCRLCVETFTTITTYSSTCELCFSQNFVNRIIDRIFQAGFVNNQASVKYYIEWVVILALHKFPQFLPKFWDCFSDGEENLKTSVCTFLSVLSHLDIITQNVPERGPVLRQALGLALRWCVHHHFSVRLYALVALRKAWSLCRAARVDGIDAWTPVVEASLSHVDGAGGAHGAGNAKRNWQRIRDHFFFAAFHPLEDYCLEVLTRGKRIPSRRAATCRRRSSPGRTPCPSWTWSPPSGAEPPRWAGRTAG